MPPPPRRSDAELTAVPTPSRAPAHPVGQGRGGEAPVPPHPGLHRLLSHHHRCSWRIQPQGWVFFATTRLLTQVRRGQRPVGGCPVSARQGLARVGFSSVWGGEYTASGLHRTAGSPAQAGNARSTCRAPPSGRSPSWGRPGETRLGSSDPITRPAIPSSGRCWPIRRVDVSSGLWPPPGTPQTAQPGLARGSSAPCGALCGDAAPPAPALGGGRQLLAYF